MLIEVAPAEARKPQDHPQQAYRAHDDFEDSPLHGTFLIDTNGLVRWQDISYQPFTQAKWLLGESKRLLALPPDATAKALTVNPADQKHAD